MIKSKDEAREYLLEIKKFVNMTAIAKQVKVSRPALQYFMKGPEYDYLISLENLDKVCEFISDL